MDKGLILQLLPTRHNQWSPASHHTLQAGGLNMLGHCCCLLRLRSAGTSAVSCVYVWAGQSTRSSRHSSCSASSSQAAAALSASLAGQQQHRSMKHPGPQASPAATHGTQLNPGLYLGQQPNPEQPPAAAGGYGAAARCRGQVTPHMPKNLAALKLCWKHNRARTYTQLSCGTLCTTWCRRCDGQADAVACSWCFQVPVQKG